MINEPTGPLSDEQRLEIAASAQQRIHDAVADYVRATKQEGDAEILSDTIVLFEARGIDGNTNNAYTRTHYIVVTDEPRSSTLLGILEIASDRLRDNLLSTGCEGCE